mgnify:FL=1
MFLQRYLSTYWLAQRDAKAQQLASTDLPRHSWATPSTASPVNPHDMALANDVEAEPLTNNPLRATSS